MNLVRTLFREYVSSWASAPAPLDPEEEPLPDIPREPEPEHSPA